MKKIFLLLTLIFCMTTIISHAQDTTTYRKVSVYPEDSTKTLIHCSKKKMYRERHTWGFYGDFNYQYGQIRTPFTSITGGSFMVLLSKCFAIGATMQRNADQSFAPAFAYGTSPATLRFLHAGYGGLKMEWIFMPQSIVHVTVPLVLGMGWANADTSPHIYSSGHYTDLPNTNSFYVVQPGVQAELNLLRHLKLYAGVNYRFSMEADLTNSLPANTLQGFGMVGGVKIGLFDLPINKHRGRY